MNSLKKILGGNTRQFGMIFALIALVLFFQWQTDGKTLTPANMMNLFNGNSYILILAIGMVIVIIAGTGACPGGRASCWGSPWAPGSVPGRGSGWPTWASRRSS